MMNFLWCAVAVIAQTTSPGLSQQLAILDELDSISLSVDYRNEKLEMIIDDLQKRLGVPVRADWASLERLGIARDDQVSLRVNSASGPTVLAALMLTLGEDLERPLYEVHAGQVVLTRLAAVGEMRLTSVYDVRDLLANETLVQRLREESPVIISEPDNEAEQSSPPSNPGEVEIGAPPDGWSIDNLPLPETTKPLSPGERLLLLITDHVDPEAWMNFGGNRALISDVNGVLMVSATPTTHRRLRDAIQLLRSANSRSITVEAAMIDLPRNQLEALSRQHAANSAALAAAVLALSDAQLLWRGADPVSIDSKLEINSSSAEIAVHIGIEPTLNHQTGELHIAIDASTIEGADHRSIKTTLSLVSGQSSALVQIPALAKQGESKRILVLTIQRQ